MMPRSVRLVRLLCALAALAVFSGCASTALKGTPFYTGEYEKRTGPAENRINAWPLLYYRDPALSILWPIIEHTDNHAAVRPLYSVYDMHGKPEYNVLWPLAQFDRKTGQNRIFPVYWGDDQAAVFPLYWHGGSPYAGDEGYDSLFPLWIYSRESATDYSLHAPWPLYNRKRDGGTEGWRLWPVYADWTRPSTYYKWYAWPLGWTWGTKSEHNRMLLPLFYQHSEEASSTFLTLPAGWSSEPGDTWAYLTPLAYYRDSPSAAGWHLWPAYAEWSRANHSYYKWYAWPLGWSWGDEDTHRRLLAPLFYQETDAGRSTFLSLLVGTRHGKDRGWSYLVPAGLHRWSPDGDAWYTLLGGARREADGDGSWYAVPALAWGRRAGDRRETWAGGLLYHSLGTPEETSSHLFPFYYTRRSGADSDFVSLPYSRHRDAAGGWSLVPPLWFNYRDSEKTFNLTPLYLWGRENETGESWSSLPPLYYRREDGTFLSPLYGSWTDDRDSRHVLVPPLLSYYRGETDRSDLWTLAGLGRLSRGRNAGPSYLFPLFYMNGRKSTVMSPLWTDWESADASRRVTTVPPLLSWVDREAGRTSLNLLLGAARFSGGAHPGSSWLLPVYYRNPESHLFLSPLYANWGDEPERGGFASPLYAAWTDAQNTRHALVLPLLGAYAANDARKDLHVLLGLGKFSWGSQPGSSWVVPLYYRNPEEDRFLSLPYARWGDDDGSGGWMIPPLLSGCSYTETNRRLLLLAGLYGRTWSVQPGGPTSSWLIPLYAAGRDYWLTLAAGRVKTDRSTFTYFPTPLVGWRSGETRGSWLFPLYLYKSETGTGDRDLYYLPWGHFHADHERTESGLFPFYYYRRQARARDGQPRELENRSWNLLYLAAYENGREPIYAWDTSNRQSRVTGVRATAGNRFFPFWRYKRTLDETSGSLEKTFTLLFFLQDYWRKTELVEKPETDYTRTRVLWRLVHYERDHDTVSTDVFPAITYDRKANDMKKVSFLWRGFRYERRNGEKDVDLLFLPVWRTRWVKSPAPVIPPAGSAGASAPAPGPAPGPARPGPASR